jgi:pimeloyl-ACP methyl ester carboxylesterase
MTEFLRIDGRAIAYEVSGEGPLVVLSHGMGDSRAAYRFVAPRLVEAGYRVAVTDLRGCGESSADWPSFTRTDIAGDLIALVRHLAAANAPELFAGIAELGPFTRKQSIRLGDLRVKRFRQGMIRLLGTGILGSVKLWLSYLDVAFPGRKPADWADQVSRIDRTMREPGRMKAMQNMSRTAPVDAGACLPDVRCPALIVMGTLDPDWADPRAEGSAIVAAMPAGLATLELIEGAGHYPHTQFPDETVALLLSFLARTAAHA